MNMQALRDRIIARSIEIDCGYETPCWISDRATRNSGYTCIKVAGAVRDTHRVAYEAFVGPIPDGLVLDHLCRQRTCCNPGHLEPVTRWENTLRGENIMAQLARRTECRQGHTLSTDPAQRKRGCRECRREWDRAYYLKSRAAA